MKIAALITIIIASFLGRTYVKEAPIISNSTNMKIESPAFAHNTSIPTKYTCDGENINPPLNFSNIPAGTKTLVLIMDDPDVPQSLRPDGLFVHWIVYDIHPSVSKIEENTRPQYQGLNTKGSIDYTGPCPPDREHRYFFKLYALDMVMPMFEVTPDKETLEQVMEGHILDQAELVGLYKRQ